ncbi:MAG: murein L,D-transpeptidase [Opitutales bacterium]|nr:murein L,D-transpeptidase [Opitutales bacterium]
MSGGLARAVWLLVWVCCPSLSSCADDAPVELSESSSVKIPVFNKQQVPSSSRSREAVTRAASSLIPQLENLGLSYGAPIFIRIFKEERELEVWLRKGKKYNLFRTYPIAAMSGQLGPKLLEGDRQAPEGFYYVSASRMNPNSRFHLSMNLGYPNHYDRVHGRTGSALMIHGGSASIGCFAMTDPKIEEIYAMSDAALRNGQTFFRVHCFPFRMSEANMKKYAQSKWDSFWANLKAGYDFFESSNLPPDVQVEGKKYVFGKATN